MTEPTVPLDVVATLEAAPGLGAELAAVVAEFADTVRAEEGCLRYDLFRVRRSEDAFVMVERWASKEALLAHGTADHFVAMSTRLAALLREPPIVRVLDPVDVG
jgi:quinol monooxygenase YgiN